jgi:hypothetical protein
MKTINKFLSVLAIIGVFAFAFASLNVPVAQNTEQSNDGTSVGIHYNSDVQIYKFTAETGVKNLVYENHNLLVNNGKEYIKTQIGSGSAVASNSTKYISLSNSASAPGAGDTVIPAEITAGTGFDRAVATYSSNGTGAWNYTKVFTATNSQSLQLTGLNYNSVSASDGNLFASLAFTPQSMLVNDQLTVVWSISVS